jgi:hypothetical protein
MSLIILNYKYSRAIKKAKHRKSSTSYSNKVFEDDENLEISTKMPKMGEILLRCDSTDDDNQRNFAIEILNFAEKDVTSNKSTIKRHSSKSRHRLKLIPSVVFIWEIGGRGPVFFKNRKNACNHTWARRGVLDSKIRIGPNLSPPSSFKNFFSEPQNIGSLFFTNWVPIF